MACAERYRVSSGKQDREVASRERQGDLTNEYSTCGIDRHRSRWCFGQLGNQPLVLRGAEARWIGVIYGRRSRPSNTISRRSSQRLLR